LYKIRKDEADAKTRRKGLVIVFFNRVKTLQNVAKILAKEHPSMKCAVIHGKIDQDVREQRLSDFKSGKTTTLLATDIAARGIHVNNVQYVINHDFPETLDQVRTKNSLPFRMSFPENTASYGDIATVSLLDTCSLTHFFRTYLYSLQYVHRCGRAGRTQDSKKMPIQAQVRSFYTAELAPIAKSVLTLLQDSENPSTTIDPKLVELAETSTPAVVVTKKKKKRKSDAGDATAVVTKKKKKKATSSAK
jgi:superfamily II DNA/RNA helicase